MLRPDRFVHFIRYEIDMPRGFEARCSDALLRAAVPGEIIGYIFSNPRGEPLVFTCEDMFHIRTYNPLDRDRGLALLLGASKALDQMEASADWNRNIANRCS